MGEKTDSGVMRREKRAIFLCLVHFPRFSPAAVTLRLPPDRSGVCSGLPLSGGALGALQHSRAYSALAVNATSPNIRWHITLFAPRTSTHLPP